MESQRALASGLCCLLLDLECYKPRFAPPGYTGCTRHNTRMLYSHGSQCDQCSLDLCNTTAVLTFKLLRPAGHQAITSTLGLSSTLTSLNKLWKESSCFVHSISMVTQRDSNNDSKAHVTNLLFGLNHSGTGTMPPSPCYAHQYTLTIYFIQLQWFSG